jgi:superfamily I DNA/RNA helicase
MELTSEQLEIINSVGDIKINAVAGSGKTSTIIEYAKSRPKGSKILYLAFNKSVKLEAERKFGDLGLKNVKIETAHSLAYKHVVFKYKYTIRVQGYKTQEIAKLLGLQANGEKHAEFIVANHINKFITYFCNSDKAKVSDLNYRDVVFDKSAKTFVNTFYDYIQEQVRLLLAKMDKREIDVSHDFYLKKFQLANPVLDFDYILFDEGQDASPAILEVFLRQPATKIIVGDTHQQIYSWRYAVNSLDQIKFPVYHLTTSFRFNQEVADLAKEVLSRKNLIKAIEPVAIKGVGKNKVTKSKAVIARSNLGLLLKAIEYVSEKKRLKHIYFEGNINSYTYADDGTSLYDVLNLYLGKHHLIRDSLIKGMKDLDELEDYIKKTEDVQLGMMVEIVEKYGEQIPMLIKEIKEKHVDDVDKHKAEMIFSTVHRSKGMEYDSVELVNDFLDEARLTRYLKETKDDEINPTRLNEEINLLYVAVTRTSNKLMIPDTLVPESFVSTDQITIYKAKDDRDEEEDQKLTIKIKPVPKKNQPQLPKSYSVNEVRKQHKGAYSTWTKEQDDKLKDWFLKGVSLNKMAEYLGRTRGAIGARIKRLNFERLF